MSTPAERAPVHVQGQVLASRAVGAFRLLTVAAPGIGARVRPGTFVAVTVTEPHLARRPVWVHRVRASGAEVAALDLVVSPDGVGTRWLADRTAGDPLTLTGPLGRPFALPKEPVGCLVVGESWYASPLFVLAERLAARDCPVTLLLGGRTEADVLPSGDLRRAAKAVHVVTEDGSLGARGTVAGALPGLLGRTGAGVVYGSGATPTMAAVADTAAAHGVWAQVTLTPPAPCGTGLCQGCAVPALTEGGRVRPVRACHEGPVFRGDRVHWSGLLADRTGTGAR